MSSQNSRIVVDLPKLAGEWRLDSVQSTVDFRSSSLWGLYKVKGRFTSMGGDARVESDGTVSGKLVIDASSVDTGNVKRDTHLRSEDFFLVARHPTIAFDLDRTRLSADGLHLGGTLSILGKSQPVELDAEIVDRDATGVTIRTKHTLDRSRWGIDFKKNGMTKMATGLEFSLRFLKTER
jgi:polyisoprenoid-binding protein YceI